MDIQVLAEAVAEAAALADSSLSALDHVPDSPNTPCVFVAETEIAYDRTMRGLTEVDLVLRVLVGRSDDRNSQRQLNAFLASEGSGSLKEAVESIRPENGGTLASSGVADDLHVRRVRGYRWYEHAGATYCGAELEVHVIG